jgi:hypothetical protein
MESEAGGYQYRLAEELFAKMKLSCCRQRWPWPLAEVANQPFDVLRSSRQKELLANKL